MPRWAILLVALLLPGCLSPLAGQPRAEGDEAAPPLAAHFSEADATGRVLALALRADGSGIRFRYLPADGAEVVLPQGFNDSTGLVRNLFTWEGGNRNRTAGGIVERVETGRVPAPTFEMLRAALAGGWSDPCPSCEGDVETFVHFTRDGTEVARRPDRENLVALRSAFQEAHESFLAGEAWQAESPAPAAGPCVRVGVVLREAVVEVGSPVRFNVSVENCGPARLELALDECYDVRGLHVWVAGEGAPPGRVPPGHEPRAASASNPNCHAGAGALQIEPGARIVQAYAWDGRIRDICRTSMDARCDTEAEARAGAVRVTGAISGLAEAQATATALLLDETARRVPLVLLSVNYTKSRVSAELPARGEGCDAFLATREPLGFTALDADGAQAHAVVMREYPQGGYGTFSPRNYALIADGAVDVKSVFDPERSLLTLRHGPDGVRAGERLLTDEPATVERAFNVTWNGEVFAVTETVEARLAGEAWLLPPSASRRDC